ncbi:hypothetical protein BD560DRAFT_429154 [Blakeslea trispora]|nr:hypothetical protein BD560DRAFT_429154 [Blakeslea trispora]
MNTYRRFSIFEVETSGTVFQSVLLHLYPQKDMDQYVNYDGYMMIYTSLENMTAISSICYTAVFLLKSFLMGATNSHFFGFCLLIVHATRETVEEQEEELPEELLPRFFYGHVNEKHWLNKYATIMDWPCKAVFLTSEEAFSVYDENSWMFLQEQIAPCSQLRSSSLLF